MTNAHTVKVKQVHRANQWCVTYFVGEKQNQSWFSTEAEARAYAQSLSVK